MQASLILFLLSTLWCFLCIEGKDAYVQPQEEVKICLVMNVHNDESVIERCLESVKEIVDCVSVCDTGSTDDSISLIKQFMQRSDIPGKIYRHHAAFATKDAHKTIKDLGFSLSHTYLLYLDPDMAWLPQSSFSRQALKVDAYLILAKSSTPSHYSYNPRLVRASNISNNFDPLFDSFQESSHCVKLHTVSIESIGDASYNAEKLEREIEKFSQAVEEGSESERTLFYLAQCYVGVKNYSEAIKWYKARIEKKGDREQIWFSKYMLGECYEELKEWSDALNWYLEAYQLDSSRAEPLRKIATYYRLMGQNDLAYLFAKHGSRIPSQDNQLLFSATPLFDYQWDEELSITAYYTRYKEEGFTAVNEVILRKNIPWHVKTQAYNNALFYVKNLPNARFQPIRIQLPLIEEGVEDRYYPMNPSIIKTSTGYKVICRAVNYTQTGAKIFRTIDKTGVFRTRNFLVEYDFDFKLLSQQEIMEVLPRQRFHSCNVAGLEDCRLFECQSDLWFTCTTFDTNPTGNLQISLCKLEEEGLNGTIHVESLTPLKGPDLYRCEKNWLPFIHDDQLYIVYSYDPFIIYKPNSKTGDNETVVEYTPIHDFSHFRGSAAPIEFEDGFLMLVHEVVVTHDYERRYLHRFLYLDSNFIVQELSMPFIFQHTGVEYCAAMIIDHSKSELILSVGIEDHDAYLCFVDLETIRSLLHPLTMHHETSFQKLNRRLF